MANLKNIVDLPVAASAEGLNLIVNDNGAAKQIAAGAVCKIKSVNDVLPDESGNVQIDTVSSWNDLKDKPFYVEEAKFIIFPSREIVYEDDCTSMSIDSIITKQLTVGGKYIVVFDGTEYECSAYIESNSNYVCLGDYQRINYPFYIENRYEAGFNLYFTLFDISDHGTTTVTHTFEIIEISETVHKLDAKYLPDMGGGPDLTLLFDYDWGLTDGYIVNMESGRIISGSLNNVYNKMHNGIPVKIDMYAIDVADRGDAKECHIEYATPRHINTIIESDLTGGTIIIEIDGFFTVEDNPNTLQLEPDGTMHRDWG